MPRRQRRKSARSRSRPRRIFREGCRRSPGSLPTAARLARSRVSSSISRARCAWSRSSSACCRATSCRRAASSARACRIFGSSSAEDSRTPSRLSSMSSRRIVSSIGCSSTTVRLPSAVRRQVRRDAIGLRRQLDGLRVGRGQYRAGTPRLLDQQRRGRRAGRFHPVRRGPAHDPADPHDPVGDRRLDDRPPLGGARGRS